MRIVLDTTYSYLGLQFATDSAVIHSISIFVGHVYARHCSQHHGPSVNRQTKKSRPHRTYILAHVDRENNQVKYTICCKTGRIRLERGSSGRRRYSFKRMFGESLLRKKEGTL